MTCLFEAVHKFANFYKLILIFQITFLSNQHYIHGVTLRTVILKTKMYLLLFGFSAVGHLAQCSFIQILLVSTSAVVLQAV